MQRPSAALSAVGLLAVVCSGWPQAADAVDRAACVAPARSANLRFALEDISGRRVALSDFRGKVLLLNFWATWCVPCRVEIPHLIALHERYESRGLAVVGISVDEVVPRIRPYVERLHVSYPVLIGRDHDAVQQSYGPIHAVPRSILIGRDGTICQRHTGLVSTESLERDIVSLL